MWLMHNEKASHHNTDTATEFGIPRKLVDLMQELFISTIISWKNLVSYIPLHSQLSELG